jgi:hypothetical protein
MEATMTAEIKMQIESDDTMHLEALQRLPFAALQRFVDSIATIGWNRDYPSLEAAWEGCARPDELLWWLARAADRRQFALCVAEMAQPALQRASDPRPAACIETLRRWARGEATVDELRASADAAEQSGRAPADKAIVIAARAAVSAVDAATAANCPEATYAAQDVASAGVAAGDSAAHGDTAGRAAQVARARLNQCAVIRRHFPRPPLPALP